MPRIIIILVFILARLTADAQNHWNLPVMSNWDDDNIPSASYGAYNECWGYHSAGREYAFLGSSKGTYFFDVTDPYTPVVIDYFPTKDTVALVINKDYAVYDHYLYAVSDQGQNSLQIFDLQYLPDSVVKVYDSDAISKRCHTLFVERDRLYMCYNTRPDNSYGPMDIYSLANPLDPQYLGTVSHPGFFTVHEVHVKNDTAYCANGYNGLWIYNVANPAAPALISILDVYPESGYNHSAWLTDDSRTMVFTDENHGLGVKIYDITDVYDPQPLAMIRSNLLQVADSLGSGGSIAHNPYIVGDLLFVSYYHDGVQVYNIADPANPYLVGWNDTYPQNTAYPSYGGCWGIYPYLPSGNIIASDMSNGLFVLDGSALFNFQPEIPVFPGLAFGQNPVNSHVELYYSNSVGSQLNVEVFDLSGKKVAGQSFGLTASGSEKFRLPVAQLATGFYVVRASDGSQSLIKKFLKSPY
jgi:choice-of-anchor B domain-containing protein